MATVTWFLNLINALNVVTDYLIFLKPVTMEIQTTPMDAAQAVKFRQDGIAQLWILHVIQLVEILLLHQMNYAIIIWQMETDAIQPVELSMVILALVLHQSVLQHVGTVLNQQSKFVTIITMMQMMAALQHAQ